MLQHLEQRNLQLLKSDKDTTIKDTGTEDTISQFRRRNQMSSSNILSIHGLKKEHQFQDSNRDI